MDGRPAPSTLARGTPQMGVLFLQLLLATTNSRFMYPGDWQRVAWTTCYGDYVSDRSIEGEAMSGGGGYLLVCFSQVTNHNHHTTMTRNTCPLVVPIMIISNDVAATVLSRVHFNVK